MNLHNKILRDHVFDLIHKERTRQEYLHPLEKGTTELYFLAVLMEEVGEVAQALQEETNVEEELIQVASVCLRWLENRN